VWHWWFEIGAKPETIHRRYTACGLCRHVTFFSGIYLEIIFPLSGLDGWSRVCQGAPHSQLLHCPARTTPDTATTWRPVILSLASYGVPAWRWLSMRKERNPAAGPQTFGHRSRPLQLLGHVGIWAKAGIETLCSIYVLEARERHGGRWLPCYLQKALQLGLGSTTSEPQRRLGRWVPGYVD